MLTKAVEWDMLRRNPFEDGGKLNKKENNEIIRFLTEDEIGRLLARVPRHTCTTLMVCALNTGMRKTELLTLKWDQIRDGLIYLTHTKSDKRREIPVNEDLAEVFKRIRQREGLKSENCFRLRWTPDRQPFNLCVQGVLAAGPVSSTSGFTTCGTPSQATSLCGVAT